MIKVISEDGFDRYLVEFTRVTELLDDPTDTSAAARMFLEEVKEDFPTDYPIIVIHRQPVDPEELDQEQIDYQFTVIAHPADVRYFEEVEAPYEFTLFADAEREPILPVWRSALFTDAERTEMLNEKRSEIADCERDFAERELDQDRLIDLMPYVDPDTEVTADLLNAIKEGHACMDDYESGEFGHHATSATHMKRFRLVTPDGCKLTSFGEAYLREYR